jgi:redox-sensitive bicupin YhaK (pirin superfamily)
LDGELRLPDPLASGSARRFSASGAGGALALASAGPARAAVLAGPALGQPVHWHGPFALARREDVEGRIAAYRTGAMGRLAPLG